MSAFTLQSTVSEIVTQHPNLSRLFEDLGIDYCCHGKKTLEESCHHKGLNPQKILTHLLMQQNNPASEVSQLDFTTLSLQELTTHIEQTHHDYLKKELPRLMSLVEKVCSVHGKKEPRLLQVRQVFGLFAQDLTHHMMKEENILFPMIQELEQSPTLPQFHCGNLGNPIRQMEREHLEAGAALDRLHILTDHFTPPAWACNTYQVLLNALKYLEHDLHFHVHKENNILFPRALDLQSQKGI